MSNETTSKRVATVAARILNLAVRPGGRIYYENVNGDLFIAPFSFGEMKAVAASALTQVANNSNLLTPGKKYTIGTVPKVANKKR